MRILITNDDGVDAPGIEVMRQIAETLSDDVWVVAPDGNQSGASHRFTFGRELGLEKREDRVFAVVGGSPADSGPVPCPFGGNKGKLGFVFAGVNY